MIYFALALILSSGAMAAGLGLTEDGRFDSVIRHRILRTSIACALVLPLLLALFMPLGWGGPWLGLLGSLWGLGFLVVAGRAGVGYYTLWALRNSGSIYFPRTDLDTEDLARRADFTGSWEVRECATREMAVPITWGLFKPVVMLPADADRWSKSRLEAVLLHELAHIRRRDFAAQALSEFACALYWFNPLVWVVSDALRTEAELSADQSVLRGGMRASDYAAELLQIAADLGQRRLPSIYVGTPAMKNNKIEARLHAILRPDC